MKRKKTTYFLFGIFILILFGLLGLTGAPVSYGVTAKRVAILPFAMNAERDLTFLREGILDMLASRLNWPGKVAIIEKGVVKSAMADHKGPVTPEYATGLGHKLKADYVLFGSLTVFGQSVSMDATMAGLTKKETPVTVFVQTKGMEAVIPEVNKFAQKVNAKIFGRPYADTEYAVIPSRYRRPYDSRLSPLNPNFMKYHQGRLRGSSLWKSRSFKSELRGMAIGDVNGDHKNELVLVEGIHLRVYTYNKGALNQVAVHESLDNQRFLAVEVADINGNGRAEIFASKMRGPFVASEVLEMKGNRLKPIVRRAPWLFRVLNWPGEGQVLLGQGVSGVVVKELHHTDLVDTFFAPGIYRLTWAGGKLVKSQEPLLKTGSLFVFNFAVGELGGDEGLEIVTIDTYDKLRVLDMEGNELYNSSDNYGGTINYIMAGQEDPTGLNPGSDSSVMKQFIYIPARILIMDLDKDGKNEVIVNKNASAVYGLTERFKAFEEGKIVSLDWTGVSLDRNWESRELAGCLSDYQVSDLDGDGKLDLVVSLIQKRAIKAFQLPRSVVISYRLSSEEGEEKKEK